MLVKDFHLFKNELHLPRDEADGFKKTLFQIDLLMFVLVIFYFILRDKSALQNLTVLVTLLVFLLLVFILHIFLLKKKYNNLTIFIENFILIGFITIILKNTAEGIKNPLVFLFSLVIIISAITLGESITIFQTTLISFCCFYISPSIFSLQEISYAIFVLFPFWMLAYLCIRLTIYRNITRKRFKKMAESDEITSLLNIRAFNLLCNQEVKVCMRYNFPFTVLMIDADNLKKVNDKHGHSAGTTFIKHIAEIIRKSLRDNDIVARFGGDEFIALLPQTIPESALSAANRIRNILKKSPLTYKGIQINITVSIGLASYPEHGRKYNDISDRADKALYKSKEMGKDRITVFSLDMIKP